MTMFTPMGTASPDTPVNMSWQSSEKTSDETLRALQPVMTEQKELFGSLKQMLQLADLVKFAKWTATPDENERSLRTAYDFVHDTTPTETVEANEIKN